MPLFLTDEEYERCSDDVSKVTEKADEFIRDLNKRLDTILAEADAGSIAAEHTCSVLEHKFVSLSSELSDLRSRNSSLTSSAEQLSSDLALANSNNHRNNIALIEKEGEIERLRAEASELQKSKRQFTDLLTQKDSEISEKNALIKAYLDKILNLTDTLSSKESRVNEVEEDLARCNASCSRLLQEKELVERHNRWLNDELTTKVNCLIELRKCNGELEADLSSKIADLERKLSESSSSLTWHKDHVMDLEKKLKSVQEDLSICQDTAAANEERHFAEMTTAVEIPSVTKLSGHHHHEHDKNKKKKTSICDDFPPTIPLIDSNTTSITCVDRFGCCNFTTVQAAVDSIGDFSQKRNIIWINNGIYLEKVIIPKTKPNITFQGQGYLSTAIAWNDTANSTHGTFYSGSVQVFSTNFVAKNISFMNLAPIPKPGDVGAQGVALRIAGDQAAFWGCGFFGAQDTLHDDRGRHYFKDCFIQGSIDFVFGNAKSFYESCQLSSIAKPVSVGAKLIDGTVTAHGRASNDENSGFAFVNCSVGGTGRIWLGRAWRPFSRVVFAFTYMSDIIAPEGWNDFNDPTRDQSIFYGEYMCVGAGANTSLRATYVQKLNDTQASPFLNVSFIDADQWLLPFNDLIPFSI